MPRLIWFNAEFNSIKWVQIVFLRVYYYKLIGFRDRIKYENSKHNTIETGYQN